MTHDDARALLLDLSYGELAPDDARAVREHLSGCAACAEEWARLGAVRGFAAKAADEPVPGRGREAILEAARRAAPARRARTRGPTRGVTWAAFATAAALLIVGGASLKLLDARSNAVSDVEAPWPAALPAEPARPPPPAARPAAPPAPARAAPDVAERSAPAAKRGAPPRRKEAPARGRDEIAAGRAGGGASFDSAAPRLRSGRADEGEAAERLSGRADEGRAAERLSGRADEGGPAGGAAVAGRVAQTPAEKVGGGEVAGERSGERRVAAAPPQENAAAGQKNAAPAQESAAPAQESAALEQENAAPAQEKAARGEVPPAAEPERALAAGERADRRAPAPSAAAAAPTAPRPARKAAAASLGAVAEDVERRRAAGELSEETRILSCAGAPLVRTLLRDRDARPVKFTVRAGGEVAEGWYDGEGRLAATRGQVGGRAVLPPRDPAPALDAPCP